MTDHVDREVYDTHQAYEIDKTKTKMLVPLDSINGQKMLNYDFEKQIAHFIHGHLEIDEQASNKIFLLNGCKKIILYNNITIK